MALVSIFDGLLRDRPWLTTHDVKFEELGQRWESVYVQRRAKDERGYMGEDGNVEALKSVPAEDGEHDHTKLMLKHGYVVEAESEQVVGGNVEPLSSAPPTVDESAPPPTAFREVPKQRHKPPRAKTKHSKYERRQSLTEMAYRLTGKSKRGQD